MGAKIVREVASKTSDQAGDGTTTATLLAAEIVKEGVKGVPAGMNPKDLKHALDLPVWRGIAISAGEDASVVVGKVIWKTAYWISTAQRRMQQHCWPRRDRKWTCVTLKSRPLGWRSAPLWETRKVRHFASSSYR